MQGCLGHRVNVLLTVAKVDGGRAFDLTEHDDFPVLKTVAVGRHSRAAVCRRLDRDPYGIQRHGRGCADSVRKAAETGSGRQPQRALAAQVDDTVN